MRSNLNGVDRSVFEITPADLHHVTFCLHVYMYARSIECMRRREKRVKRWLDVERGKGFFDRITVISVELILRQCFGVLFYEGRIVCFDRIKS